MRWAILLLSAALLAAQQTAPSPPEPRVPSVSGKVINTATGEGVRKASVLLRSQNGRNSFNFTADTDGNGNFVIEDVDPGKYAVTAGRQGFLQDIPGSEGAPPPPITVEKDQALRDVVVRMTPLGVIVGRVLDDDGDPIRGVLVQAKSYRYVAGKRQLGDAQSAQSNDKGEFRVYGLRPGTYYLYAAVMNYSGNRNQEQIRGPRPAGRASTYYPNATDAAHAAPIEVAAGALLRGFDIQMRRERIFSVRGKLPESQGQSDRRYFVRVTPRDSHMGISSFGSVMNNSSFECSGLPPGEYVLIATMFDGNKQIQSRQFVNIVDSDVEVTLNFSPPIDVSGTVRVDGQTIKFPEELRVSLQPDQQTGMGGASALVKADGTFLLKSVSPDVYALNFNAPQGSYIKSIGAADHDGSNWQVDLTKGSGPIAIVLGTDVGVVEGTVENAAGEPAMRVRVNLIPYGKNLGRGDLSRFAFTGEKGNFKMRGTSPGEYKLFAWDNVEFGAPQDPEFRKRYEKLAVPVKLEPNGHETVKLKLINVSKAGKE